MYSMLNKCFRTNVLLVSDLPYPEIRPSILFTNISGSCTKGLALYNMSANNLEQCKWSCAKNANCSAFVTQVEQMNEISCIMKSGTCEGSTVSPQYKTYLKGIDTAGKYFLLFNIHMQKKMFS